VVFPPLDTWPEIEKLEKQGHTIVKPLEGGPIALRESTGMMVCKLLSEADIILGPRCWYLTGLHRKHLQSAIKQARLRRYGTISKRGKDNEQADNPSTDPESAGR